MWERVRILLAVVILLLFGHNSFAVDLEWDSPSGPQEVDGYRVHWGAESGIYTNSQDVGNALQASLPIPLGSYINVTAYNEHGESDYDGEVYYTGNGNGIQPASGGQITTLFIGSGLGEGSRELNGSNQYLDTAILPVSGTPFTLCAWVKLDQLSSVKGDEQCAAAFGDDSAITFLNLRADMNDRLQFNSGPLPTAIATSNNTITAGTWEHWCGIAALDNERRVVLNGDWTNSGINTDSKDPWNALDNFNVGRLFMNSTAYDYLGGKIAHVAVWNVALDQSEIQSLSECSSPDTVRTMDLVAYWPLVVNDNDDIGGNNLTPHNSPTWSTIDYPTCP